FALGDCAAARTHYGESLTLFRELRDRREVAHVLESLAAVLLAQADAQKAVRLWGAAEALRESIGSPLPPNEREKHARQVAQARSVLDEEAFVSAWGEGRAMLWEQAVDDALETRNPPWKVTGRPSRLLPEGTALPAVECDPVDA